MKTLLIGEYKNGKFDESFYELVGFAKKLDTEAVGFVIAPANIEIDFEGKVYTADINSLGEYNPFLHKKAILDVIAKEDPDLIVFSHSSYGWDLAPRIAMSIKAGQISEVIGIEDGCFIVGICNSKLRRKVRSKTSKTIITLQSGAFPQERSGKAKIEILDIPDANDSIKFLGYEVPEKTGVDLTKAEIIVSAGRGIGKKENIETIRSLAKALNGELGASRPVVDAGWVDAGHQVGTTGQTVSPKLYVACGISGAIQHLAGMKRSNFIVAINKDKDAPIAEVADVFVCADLNEFVPTFIKMLSK